MWKNLLESYEDKDGNNPFSAGLNLLTFTKSIPLQVLKGAILAVLLFVAFISGLVILDAPVILIIIGAIVGFIGMLFIGVTGVLKFLTDDFMGSIQEFIMGVLNPIDDLYAGYQQEAGNHLSKKEFAGKVFKDAIGPLLKDTIGKVPLGGKLHDRVNQLMDDLVNDEEVDQAMSASDDVTIDAVSFGAPITNAIDRSRKKINSPFSTTLKWVLIVWAGVYVLYLLTVLL